MLEWFGLQTRQAFMATAGLAELWVHRMDDVDDDKVKEEWEWLVTVKHPGGFARGCTLLASGLAGSAEDAKELGRAALEQIAIEMVRGL